MFTHFDLSCLDVMYLSCDVSVFGPNVDQARVFADVKSLVVCLTAFYQLCDTQRDRYSLSLLFVVS